MLTVLIADARLFETSVLELWDERIRERIGGGEEIKVRCEEGSSLFFCFCLWVRLRC